MKLFATIFLLTICSFTFAQTNLLDPSTWTVGNGSAPGFSKNGTDAENVRETGINQFGESAVLWKAVPDANNDAYGGWYSSYHNIDHNNTYRFSVWIKKTNSTNGTTYFGMSSLTSSGSDATLLLDGTSRPNAYFWFGDLPQLNKWYLLVGFLHQSSYTGTTNIGGVYDPTTGAKVLNAIYEFKFQSGANRLRQRTFLYYDTNTADRQYFSDPAVYQVNGQEPSIQEMIDGGNSNPGSGTSVWNTNGNDINYTSGKVGIGTSSPDYDLTVNGNIHAKEVKVDLSVPAPDYVFKEDYELRSLQEIQQFINENGHLPNIPSALEMEENGVALGTMEMKLLEKVEELTLYVLKQQKQYLLLQRKLSQLEYHIQNKK